MKEIRQLLNITMSLKEKYGRNFSLDGKLVGDIGEVLVAEKYGLKLLSENEPIHDAVEKSSGRNVQIKASFKNYSYFPYADDKRPDYFISVNILENGELEELFNGPGQFLFEKYILARGLKDYKKTYYTLSKGILKDLNSKVPKKDKIRMKI